MTMNRYDTISLGTSLADIHQMVGTADKTASSHRGKQLLYIERIPISQGLTLHRHYTLTFANGRLVNKTYKEIKQPLLDVGSY